MPIYKKQSADYAREEIEKCEEVMSVWAILKDGDVVGRITARYLRSGAVNVTLRMFGSKEVIDYSRRTCSYNDRIREAIGEVIRRQAKELEEYYGLSDMSSDWNWVLWQRYFERYGHSGYKVVQVI